MRAAARSKGAPHPRGGASARWSPNGSSRPPHPHWRGACGSGARWRLNRDAHIQPLGMRNSGAVGRAMMARGPPEPACDRRRARDAGSRSRKWLSSAIVSKLAAAERCQPRKGSPNSRPCGAWGGRPPPIRIAHGGVVKPWHCRWDAASAMVFGSRSLNLHFSLQGNARLRAFCWSCPWMQTSAMVRNRPWRRCWRMPGPRSLWCPASYLRWGERADGRPAVGSNRPKEIMSCRHKSPRKKKEMPSRACRATHTWA